MLLKMRKNEQERRIIDENLREKKLNKIDVKKRNRKKRNK
jgi:hypothetical protein